MRLARLIGTAKLRPAPGAWRMAVFMPITCPAALISGPPLLPGFTAASVWMYGTR